jgi:hypothetical protein
MISRRLLPIRAAAGPSRIRLAEQRSQNELAFTRYHEIATERAALRDKEAQLRRRIAIEKQISGEVLPARR